MGGVFTGGFGVRRRLRCRQNIGSNWLHSLLLQKDVFVSCGFDRQTAQLQHLPQQWQLIFNENYSYTIDRLIPPRWKICYNDATWMFSCWAIARLTPSPTRLSSLPKLPVRSLLLSRRAILEFHFIIEMHMNMPHYRPKPSSSGFYSKFANPLCTDRGLRDSNAIEIVCAGKFPHQGQVSQESHSHKFYGWL